MKKLSEKKLQKKLIKIKNNHKFIPEYVENYSLIHTGNKDDVNNYDLTLKDDKGNQLILRKTTFGDQTAEVLFIVKTEKGKFVNQQRIYNQNELPVNIYCMKSEKEWKFSFKGNMVNVTDLQKEVSYVEFEASFKSDEPMIDIYDQIDYRSSAKKLKDSFADQQTFVNDKFYEQVSYAQNGIVNGEVKFKDETVVLNTQGLRKHNFGKLSLQSLLKYLNIA